MLVDLYMNKFSKEKYGQCRKHGKYYCPISDSCKNQEATIECLDALNAIYTFDKNLVLQPVCIKRGNYLSYLTMKEVKKKNPRLASGIYYNRGKILDNSIPISKNNLLEPGEDLINSSPYPTREIYRGNVSNKRKVSFDLPKNGQVGKNIQGKYTEENPYIAPLKIFDTTKQVVLDDIEKLYPELFDRILNPEKYSKDIPNYIPVKKNGKTKYYRDYDSVNVPDESIESLISESLIDEERSKKRAKRRAADVETDSEFRFSSLPEYLSKWNRGSSRDEQDETSETKTMSGKDETSETQSAAQMYETEQSSTDSENSPYNILGVTRDTPIKDINAQYRKLSKKFHPDKNIDPNADEVFKKINNAHKILIDNEKRIQYDSIRNQEPEEIEKWKKNIARVYKNLSKRLTSTYSASGQVPDSYFNDFADKYWRSLALLYKELLTEDPSKTLKDVLTIVVPLSNSGIIKQTALEDLIETEQLIQEEEETDELDSLEEFDVEDLTDANSAAEESEAEDSSASIQLVDSEEGSGICRKRKKKRKPIKRRVYRTVSRPVKRVRIVRRY